MEVYGFLLLDMPLNVLIVVKDPNSVISILGYIRFICQSVRSGLKSVESSVSHSASSLRALCTRT